MGNVEIQDCIIQVGHLEIRDCFAYGNDWTGKPIPLTPEWLEIAGFENKTTSWHTSKYFVKDRYEYWLGEREDDNALFRNDHYLAKCQYVHQLQNLYFALTGEELTFT